MIESSRNQVHSKPDVDMWTGHVDSISKPLGPRYSMSERNPLEIQNMKRMHLKTKGWSIPNNKRIVITVRPRNPGQRKQNQSRLPNRQERRTQALTTLPRAFASQSIQEFAAYAQTSLSCPKVYYYHQHLVSDLWRSSPHLNSLHTGIHTHKDMTRPYRL